ncbi:VOC family protein [Oceanobacillus polygoni]|uniref:Catechol 2,3-dioxygenase-like lactoylglutathione lyase family enzyme n=1 Tax=Oceanobacillus polygoni TaxID=1235259 RepID=A0A9X0YQC9_9BACI|nr:VOC family protein [Oceanobacillus polygoni]MBP2076862.1 catechol 2,3-dioxygenase-like lactoylglutathione lyase family enzyme [Oceanobacillus polygoni]
MTAITHIGLSVPDIEAAIKWYGEVLGFKLIAGPYTFVSDLEKEPNMTNDLLGKDIKTMRNAHLISQNQVGLELFEFQEPKMEDKGKQDYQGYFHICLIADNMEELADKIANSGGKKRSDIWNTWEGKPYYLVYCEDPFGNIIELYSHSTETMYANKE